ncbi:MAG: hypothetical protein JJ844_05635 [Prochlorococcus marinus CUG1435]|nr:hypothetical protein [Prochlorococcus marinus CUG1435]
MLLTKLKVKEDKVSEYLKIANKTNKPFEAEELGMLHHTFDQIIEAMNGLGAPYKIYKTKLGYSKV